MADAPLWVARAALVAVGLGLWFWTQRLIGARPFPSRGIGDAVHDWTEPWNRWLNAHPRGANALLIASSAVIDLLAFFLLGAAISGPTFRPFVGLLLLDALRQLCQGLCAFAPPEGMIWRSPGVPSLLVTYGTATDLFFSGHTAIAVYGALELMRLGGPWLVLLGVAIALFEAGAGGGGGAPHTPGGVAPGGPPPGGGPPPPGGGAGGGPGAPGAGVGGPWRPAPKRFRG